MAQGGSRPGTRPLGFSGRPPERRPECGGPPPVLSPAVSRTACPPPAWWKQAKTGQQVTSRRRPPPRASRSTECPSLEESLNKLSAICEHVGLDCLPVCLGPNFI